MEALRDLVESDDLDGLLAGADPESDEVVAITQDQELRCTEVDMTALEEISRAWLESIRVTP